MIRVAEDLTTSESQAIAIPKFEIGDFTTDGHTSRRWEKWEEYLKKLGYEIKRGSTHVIYPPYACKRIKKES